MYKRISNNNNSNMHVKTVALNYCKTSNTNCQFVLAVLQEVLSNYTRHIHENIKFISLNKLL